MGISFHSYSFVAMKMPPMFHDSTYHPIYENYVGLSRHAPSYTKKKLELAHYTDRESCLGM